MKISAQLLVLSALLSLTSCGPKPDNATQSDSPTSPQSAQTNASPSTRPPPLPASTNVPTPPSTNAAPTPAANTNEVAIIRTTAGDMVVEFWPDVAPKTVENFKKLARQGFYDGTAFHRIIKGFMIQGGDPLTKSAQNEPLWGTGDPGYKIAAEFNPRLHERGVLSMARGNDINSAGSQFFVMLDRAPHLDGKYTGFGKLIRGEDVLLKIGETPVEPNAAGEPSKPLTRVQVNKVELAPADSIQ